MDYYYILNQLLQIKMVVFLNLQLKKIRISHGIEKLSFNLLLLIVLIICRSGYCGTGRSYIKTEITEHLTHKWRGPESYSLSLNCVNIVFNLFEKHFYHQHIKKQVNNQYSIFFPLKNCISIEPGSEPVFEPP